VVGLQSRAPWLVLLLLLEGLCLGVSFDSAALERFGPGWWSPIVDIAGRSMPAAATVFAALALVLAAESRRTSEPPPWRLPHRPSPFVAAELVAFGCVWWLGAELFRAEGSAGAPTVRFAAWLVALVATLGAWFSALIPPRELVALARRRAGWLVLALALGAVAVAAGRSAQELWLPLRRATFAAARAALGVIEPSVIAEPETLILGADDFAVVVAAECSGYEGLGLALVFTLAALALFRDVWRFPRAWWLVPIALIAVWSANVVRLVALIWIGAHVSPTIALGGFHSYAGTLLFCGAALSTVALGLRSPWFARGGERAGSNPAAPYLVPFLATLVAGLASRAFAGADGEPLAFLPPLVGLVALACFLGTYRAWDWRPTPFAWGAGLAVAIVWYVAVKASSTPSASEEAPAGLALVFGVVQTIIVAPCVEELGFRGFLARRIGRWDFESVDPKRLPWIGIAVSSLAFGLLHRSVLPAILSGVVFALVYRRRGRLADAIWAHAVANAALLITAFATDEWRLWT
jgi:uncharacterized protein